MKQNLVVGVAVGVLTMTACSSSPDAGDASTTATVVPTASAAPTSVAVTVVPTLAVETPNISTEPGTEIGRSSTGRTITNPVPWDTGTIYVDDATPEYFEFGFNAPDPDCIAAEVTATIGRGGAILLSLFVDGDHEIGAPCREESGNNPLSLTLDEPLAGRRIYTDSSVYYGEESAPAERLSDEVIGLELDDAVAVIEDAGFESEVIPADPDARASIFVAERINLYLAADGTVEFAAPG